MGSAFPFEEDESFDRKVKRMADEELLEFWEESQLLENMLNAGAGTNRYVLSPEYERAILKELFFAQDEGNCRPRQISGSAEKLPDKGPLCGSLSSWRRPPICSTVFLPIDF